MYRVIEAQCDRLIDALTQLQPKIEALLSPDGTRYFEVASLRRFVPAI